jgi:shikimate kinase
MSAGTPEPDRHLVLVGLMGAGKTTVGRICAQRLERAFVDTDDVVAALAGMTVPEIFATFGEEHFRELERQAVADVCATPAALVVACGGGVVIDAANRKRLGDAGFVVWLRADVDVLSARCGDGEGRPLLAAGAPASLARLSVLRDPLYEAVADVTVGTDERAPEEVATAVLDAYCGAKR